MAQSNVSHKLHAVCVYCGARPGAGDIYLSAARRAGNLLAERGISLIYGAGSTGMMGAIADGVLEAGGEVVGVIPRGLHRHEQTHKGLSTLHVVDDMHQRKALMEVLSDGLIALPGGYGTLDEMFEALTWSVLGIHQKPCGMLNVNGYWDPLMATVEHMLAEEFISQTYHERIILHERFEDLLDDMERHIPAEQIIWQFGPGETPRKNGKREKA